MFLLILVSVASATQSFLNPDAVQEDCPIKQCENPSTERDSLGRDWKCFCYSCNGRQISFVKREDKRGWTYVVSSEGSSEYEGRLIKSLHGTDKKPDERHKKTLRNSIFNLEKMFNDIRDSISFLTDDDHPEIDEEVLSESEQEMNEDTTNETLFTDISAKDENDVSLNAIKSKDSEESLEESDLQMNEHETEENDLDDPHPLESDNSNKDLGTEIPQGELENTEEYFSMDLTDLEAGLDRLTDIQGIFDDDFKQSFSASAISFNTLEEFVETQPFIHG